jgi:hypothetical protein
LGNMRVEATSVWEQNREEKFKKKEGFLNIV